MASRTITWIDTNGVETELSKMNGIRIINELKGFQMPPISYIEEEAPFQHGTRHRETKVEPRELDIPIRIDAENSIALEAMIRRLLRTFNPLKGDGRLRVTSFDGSQRELYCRYVSGLEMDEGVRGPSWLKAVIVFRAFDPYWWDRNTKGDIFKAGQPTSFFPFFPLRLSSSTVFADTTTDNTGDVETWPQWNITGPGQNITLRNLTTGEVVHLKHEDGYLGVGEQITIDARPFYKTIIKNDGTNLFPALSDDSSLWALQDGNNAIRLEMSGATNDSSIQLTYRNRYWGA